MSAILALPILWGQMPLPNVPESLRGLVVWLYVLGEPSANYYGTSWLSAIESGLILWVKVLSLICLLGWVASWLTAALRERTLARTRWLDVAALAAIVGAVGTVLLNVLETTHRVPYYKIGGVYAVTALSTLWGLIFFLWIETALWSAIGKAGRRNDHVVLAGLHLALVLGIVVALAWKGATHALAATHAVEAMPWSGAVVLATRLSATYMGYVVLFRVALVVAGETLAVRARRLYAIANLTVVESNRRMWAPWVVITVFLVVLAFTHWFLQAPRPAEMGRLFVGTLTLLCSLLMTVMITLLTPLSLPQDIKGQTIYTVVSKPVRRIELIWGRMLGFMAIVTVLMLVFGLVSLAYLKRTVGGAIEATNKAAVKAANQGRMTEARQLREQAEQIRNRMAARVPINGSLTFLDSKGTPHLFGIDVGAEQSMREPRSHIEGATPATAIWRFGVVRDPLSRPNERPRYLDCRIPVHSLLRRDTVEALLDRTIMLRTRIDDAERRRSSGALAASQDKELSAAIARDRAELQQAADAYKSKKDQADALAAEADAAEKAGKADAADLRARAEAMHTPNIPLEMTFNVYRTTKGRVGEPVYAEIEVANPVSGAPHWRNIFPIREYYTNKQEIPASLLAGAGGSVVGRETLRVEIRCISPTQYLGMAQSDLFLLANRGNFGTNFMMGLFGVWLQALVLTAIGVFAGTFLRWQVALLTTIAFFLAGQVAFAFLLDFANQSLQGGGPFESLIRLVGHDNLMTELSPTLAVVVAKTLDAMIMPVMSRLAFVVPNFTALDVSNTVANGFSVSPALMAANLLLAFAYALPFSIAGYFILKNREVAA